MNMDVLCRLYVAFAVLSIVKGLEIASSPAPGFGKFYNAGSNLRISCSEDDLFHMDWKKETSIVAQCSRDKEPYCLPGGRYTYENGSFNMMLMNMTSEDCGQYVCSTRTGSKSFDLHLIEHVKGIDVVESNNSVTMTTDCVYPSNTVKILWFYIHKDGSPVVYNKPANRFEETGECKGQCWENKASKVSSTLDLPTDVKNPIQVKLMMYIRQGETIQTKTTSRLYTIEGCFPPTKGGIIFVMCLAVVLIIMDVVIILTKLRQREHNIEEGIVGKHFVSDNVKYETDGEAEINIHVSEEKHLDPKEVCKGMPNSDVIRAILVSGVIILCCVLMLHAETKIPDINDNCKDVHITTAFAIAFFFITISVHWKLIRKIGTKIVKWIRDKVQNKRRSETSGESEEKAAEIKTLIPDDNEGCVDEARNRFSTNVDSGVVEGDDDEKANNTTSQVTEEQSKQELEAKQKREFEDSYTQETKRCNTTLPCSSLRKNEVIINVGSKVKLTCILDTKKYPSWKSPSGKVINYEKKKEFGKVFRNRLYWDTDKKSIFVSNVDVSDAGTYVCESCNGSVQTLNLVVILPTKNIEVTLDETAHLDPGDDIARHRPAWRRSIIFVPELYNKVQDGRIELEADGKGIFIKNCQYADTGMYEMIENNVIKRFDVFVKNKNNGEQTNLIDEGSTIRLDSSSNEKYPSWECVEAGVFNYGGEDVFKSVNAENDTNKLSRFDWSVDQKSLMIKSILPEDSGTYICRHANGFMETVTVTVKANSCRRSSSDRLLVSSSEMCE